MGTTLLDDETLPVNKPSDTVIEVDQTEQVQVDIHEEEKGPDESHIEIHRPFDSAKRLKMSTRSARPSTVDQRISYYERLRKAFSPK